MTWIKFTDQKPPENERLITRHPGYRSKGDAFETWEKWDPEYLKISYSDGRGHITHWWQGDYDFDLAIESWDQITRK